jgi:hypothetical protein
MLAAGRPEEDSYTSAPLVPNPNQAGEANMAKQVGGSL